jgi:major capsid protein E
MATPITNVPLEQLDRTSTMLETIVSFPRAPQFLRDKLFSVIETSPTDQVMIDYFKGAQKLAPFCSRYKPGISIPRERVKTSDAFETNPNVTDAYNKLNIQPGVLDPKTLQDLSNFGVTALGTYRQLPLFVDEAQYQDESGTSSITSHLGWSWWQPPRSKARSRTRRWLKSTKLGASCSLSREPESLKSGMRKARKPGCSDLLRGLFQSRQTPRTGQSCRQSKNQGGTLK